MILFLLGLIIGILLGAWFQSLFKGSDCDECQDRANDKLVKNLRAKGEIPEEESLDGIE